MLRIAITAAIGISATMLHAGLAEASPALNGVWARGDGNARVKIEPCGPDFCATNIWVKDTSRGEAVGDVLVMMVRPKAGDHFAGKAYDRKRKLTYSMDIRVKPEGLTSRGCVLGGLACKAVAWTRIR